ncbi:MAG TPA: Rieske (2Fe-2S) protein [Candidatus Binataceae bacterium]|nr:Rieske (2Fe-2S) protein [Candidatus Binataceae bacterium]
MANEKVQLVVHEAPLSPERRAFLTKVSIALSALAAAAVGIPVVGFLLAPLLQSTPDIWRSVGKTDDFEIGKTVRVTFVDPSPLKWAGVTANTAAWLRRRGDNDFVAFAMNCTHLGCPVRWLDDANLFMCPCHGGIYYADGEVAAGPPPHALFKYPVRIRDGQVEILTSAVPLG